MGTGEGGRGADSLRQDCQQCQLWALAVGVSASRCQPLCNTVSSLGPGWPMGCRIPWADLQDPWGNPDIVMAWNRRSRSGHFTPNPETRRLTHPLPRPMMSRLPNRHQSALSSLQRCSPVGVSVTVTSVSSILGALGILGYSAHISWSQGLPALAPESSS